MVVTIPWLLRTVLLTQVGFPFYSNLQPVGCTRASIDDRPLSGSTIKPTTDLMLISYRNVKCVQRALAAS